MKKSFFVTYKNPLLVLIFLILASGVYSYTKIHSALFPQITFPKIKIIADAGQQPVNQMKVGVTKVLEDAVKKVPDLQVLKSTTSRGSCEISAFMDWNVNVDLSKQQVESAIAEVKAALEKHPIKIFAGEDSLSQVMKMDSIDMVLTAVVGFAGLKPTLAAIESGKCAERAARFAKSTG